MSKSFILTACVATMACIPAQAQSPDNLYTDVVKAHQTCLSFGDWEGIGPKRHRTWEQGREYCEEIERVFVAMRAERNDPLTPKGLYTSEQIKVILGKQRP